MTSPASKGSARDRSRCCLCPSGKALLNIRHTQPSSSNEACIATLGALLGKLRQQIRKSIFLPHLRYSSVSQYSKPSLHVEMIHFSIKLSQTELNLCKECRPHEQLAHGMKKVLPSAWHTKSVKLFTIPLRTAFTLELLFRSPSQDLFSRIFSSPLQLPIYSMEVVSMFHP